MKKRNILLAIMLTIACTVSASDFYSTAPLKLTTPAMDAKSLSEDFKAKCTEKRTLNIGNDTQPTPYTDLATPEYRMKDHAPWSKENWTLLRTNPDVKPYKMLDDLTFVGVPLFVAGIIAKSEKKSFRQNTKDNKHTLVTDFKTRIDDYAQFFGPTVTTAMKIAGLESRSDWERYAAATAMSYGIMAGFVNTIKYTSKEMRPDGSSANSWPSGHTATAFVGATILHKEYGMTRSPWFSVAGYGVATATGVMRVLNNRHWVSDVLPGAGIGIMSAELAYALSDLIFKKRGLLRADIVSDKNIIEHPSFFSISMGMGFGSKNLDFDMEQFGLDFINGKNFNLKFGTSTAVGAEGAYFFNKYVGVGGRVRVNSSPIKGWNGIVDYAWEDLIEGLYGNDYTEDEKVHQFLHGTGIPGQPGYSPALI